MTGRRPEKRLSLGKQDDREYADHSRHDQYRSEHLVGHGPSLGSGNLLCQLFLLLIVHVLTLLCAIDHDLNWALRIRTMTSANAANPSTIRTARID